MTDKPKVALIGAGSMGGALLRGWIDAGAIAFDRSAVFDPAPPADIAALCKKHAVMLNPDVGRADVVVVAVKPQIAAQALPAYARLASGAIVISVMAGKSIASVSAALGGAKRVARVMPNLPAAMGKGVSGLYAPPMIDQAGRDIIEFLIKAAGETVWVDTERAIDFITAVSGSGPAYYFLLTEALADAGEALGLPKEAAEKLARSTFTGAGALMEQEIRSPAAMRRAVTSPGGTTEAALKILNGDDQALRKLIRQAVKAAAERAGDLTE